MLALVRAGKFRTLVKAPFTPFNLKVKLEIRMGSQREWTRLRAS